MLLHPFANDTLASVTICATWVDKGVNVVDGVTDDEEVTDGSIEPDLVVVRVGVDSEVLTDDFDAEIEDVCVAVPDGVFTADAE